MFQYVMFSLNRLEIGITQSNREARKRGRKYDDLYGDLVMACHISCGPVEEGAWDADATGSLCVRESSVGLRATSVRYL